MLLSIIVQFLVFKSVFNRSLMSLWLNSDPIRPSLSLSLTRPPPPLSCFLFDSARDRGGQFAANSLFQLQSILLSRTPHHTVLCSDHRQLARSFRSLCFRQTETKTIIDIPSCFSAIITQQSCVSGCVEPAGTRLDWVLPRDSFFFRPPWGAKGGN